MRRFLAVAAVGLLMLPAGCGVGDEPEPRPVASSAATFDQALHDELVAMSKRDQAGRTGGTDPEGDTVRTERLKQIIAAQGWPTVTTAGRDGAEAAWLIAQHSDADPAFQARALELLTAAAQQGQASRGNVAYLTDRVAVGKGQPQTYGTQIRCGARGPEPTTPIQDEATVDRRRAEAGLQPLDDYYAELGPTCEAERTQPSGS